MIDKRLLKEMPETKPYIIKQVGMQWISLLCNIVFVALMAYVLDGVYKKTVTVQDLFLITGESLSVSLSEQYVYARQAYILMRHPVMYGSTCVCVCSQSCWK